MRPKSARCKLVAEADVNALDNLRVRWRKFAEIEVVGAGDGIGDVANGIKWVSC